MYNDIPHQKHYLCKLSKLSVTVAKLINVLIYDFSDRALQWGRGIPLFLGLCTAGALSPSVAITVTKLAPSSSKHQKCAVFGVCAEGMGKRMPTDCIINWWIGKRAWSLAFVASNNILTHVSYT